MGLFAKEILTQWMTSSSMHCAIFITPKTDS
jgi:hypothetical protein